MKIQNKTAIVTGGSGGLGESCVRNLVNNGANVAIFDIKDEAGASLARELSNSCIYLSVDVTDHQSIGAAVATVTSKFSAPQILINCAGGGAKSSVSNKSTYSHSGPIDMSAFKETIELNVIGTMEVSSLMAAAAASTEADESGERGVIINVSSAIAFEAPIGMIGYAAAKSSIAGMTLPMARELAEYGIRVMTVAPGMFETESFHSAAPNQRWSTEETKHLTANVPHPSRLGQSSEFSDLCEAIIRNPMLNGDTIRLDGALRIPYM